MPNQHPDAFSRRQLAVTVLGVLSCLVGAAALKGADSSAATGSSGDKVVLLDGKDLDAWKSRDAKAKGQWQLAREVKLDPGNPRALTAAQTGPGEGAAAVLLKPVHGADLVSTQEFGDGEFHCEFMVPKGSNSGFYLMGRYEVQILDSHGKPKNRLSPGDLGGIYSTKAPSENASKPAGEWQTLDVVFRAPRFDSSGKKTSNALFALVKLNGTTIHENVEAPKPTGSEIDSKEAAKGPIMLQGDHGQIAFRNIWVRPVAMRGEK